MTIIVGKPSGVKPFVTKFFSGYQTATSPITITPPAGQRVRLNALTLNTFSGEVEPNVDIFVGGELILSALTLRDDDLTADGDFTVGTMTGSLAMRDYVGGTLPIVGEIDQIIEIKKVADAPATYSWSYSYEFGE